MTLKKLIKKYWFFVLIAGTLIVLDQWTKSLVRANLDMGEIWSPWPWLSPYARIVHWYNTGVAFGMFQDHGMLFTVLNSIIAGFILIFFPRLSENDWFLKVALSMQFGGAVGNLIDRMTIGHVTDFVSIGNFAVFNVADASVTTGVAVMIIGLWIQEKKEKNQKILMDETQHLDSKPEI
ncbi:signal peptidase II [Pelolinea submarina]|uniref:Lipoprotein signal peptidase n=1 Tax=Pelolinea submarina TaxID=913107 RepID=A0A3E0AHU9_9CHLR|nr:signal peptidase II [Pelolinea submarina]REG11252.1 signal peptidase II [Pelolinea submarina]